MIRSLLGSECICSSGTGEIIGVMRVGEKIQYVWVRLSDGSELRLAWNKVKII